MRKLTIKRGAKVRVVYAPERPLRRRLVRLLPVLAAAERKAALALGVEAVAHGFIQGRSPVTMASAHQGFPVSISCDLTGWFDSVQEEQIAAGLALAGFTPEEARLVAAKVCFEGAPRQGLPTSPSAANIAAVVLDRAILDRLAPGAVYTRYADDLTVSLPDGECSPQQVREVLGVLRSCAEDMGWSINERKTEIQWASGGRRVLCGVAVGETDVRATRRVRRKLRAAMQQALPVITGDNSSPILHAGKSAAGLYEWCQMKLPRVQR